MSARDGASADKAPPAWAFVVNPPGAQPAPDDGTLRRVPGSSVAFTLTQIRDLFAVPDWRPADHPPMPEVVSHGAKPAVFACGYCHLPNGLGRPENSSLAGLPAEYIVQQVADFKSGARKSSEPASRSVNASSRCRRTWNAPNCATRLPVSSLTFQPAASGKARPWSDLMKAVVAQLNDDDMVAIAAYTASRVP